MMLAEIVAQAAPNPIALSPLARFLWGFGGSIAVEIVAAYQTFNQAAPDEKVALPKRYFQIQYCLVRLLLAIVAGGLAVAYHIDNPLVAANVGAATPLIIHALAQTIPPGTPRDPPSPTSKSHKNRVRDAKRSVADGNKPAGV